MIPETKIYGSLPIGNFVIDGYSTPSRIDQNCNGGGILLYVREEIPFCLIATNKSAYLEFWN